MTQKPLLKWPEVKSEQETEAARFELIHKFVVLVCSSLILVITSYGISATLTGHVNVVGATLVDFEFPPPSISPIYAKPISYLMVASLALAFSGLELAKPHMAKFTKSQLSLIRLFAFIGIVLAGYEVLYNFALWSAEIATSSLLGVLNPDVLLTPPLVTANPRAPLNLVFATKISTTILAVSVYVFYVMRQIDSIAES
jgi:hypothetical protein